MQQFDRVPIHFLHHICEFKIFHLYIYKSVILVSQAPLLVSNILHRYINRCDTQHLSASDDQPWPERSQRRTLTHTPWGSNRQSDSADVDPKTEIYHWRHLSAVPTAAAD